MGTSPAASEQSGTPLLSTRAFAAQVGVTPETVLDWVKAGKLRPIGRTPGGHYRFSPAQVEGVLNGWTATRQAKDIEEHVVAAQERLRIRARARFGTPRMGRSEAQ